MEKQQISPYEFHTGMAFRQIKGHPEPVDKWQWQGHCPFCKKLDHFFFGLMSANKGWDCKHCQRGGNVYTFLKHIHQDVCTEDLVPVLAMERGVDVKYFIKNGVRWNPMNQSFVIPTYNDKGNLNYLYKVVLIDGKRRIYNIPGMDPTLFNWPQNCHDTVWVLEGLMDKIAAEDIIGTREITPIGVPGSTFKQTWTNPLAGKNVFILTDNDDAGENLAKLILDKIKTAPSKPTSIKQIKWPTDLPKKFDVNDTHKKFKYDAFDYIMRHTEEKELSSVGSVSSTFDIIPDESAKKFDDIATACKEYYHFTLDMRRLLILMATSVYSLKIDGEQIWVRVIAPPGSFKSTACKIIGSSAWTVLQSTFTGLFSGWADDDPTDASLIPMIAGKALIVKDADALLQQPNKEQIFSQLRDFYDKSSAVTYLNRRKFNYENIRSSFIFCGTHALRGMDNSALGERFIDFELRVTDEDRNAIAAICSARANNMDNPEINEKESAIFRKAKNFIDNELFNRNDIVKLNDSERSLIEEQCKLAAFMRAKVDRSRSGEVMYKPFAETPSRLVGQMIKLANCAPVVLGHSDIQDETLQLVSKTIADIIDTGSVRYQIAEFLSAAGHQSLNQLVTFLNVNQKTVERELDNMRLLNMLDIKRVALGPNTGVAMAGLKPNFVSQMNIISKAIS